MAKKPFIIKIKFSFEEMVFEIEIYQFSKLVKFPFPSAN